MPRRLLVTDDAVIIREMIKDAARGAGWTIAGEAGDGIEAVERFRELRPDAVTLDLVMPRRGGIETLREMLAIDPTARVVVVSALEQKSILRQAFQIGAADFLVKPFDRKTLVQTLDALVPPVEGVQQGLS
ncbi:MAG: response regulator [Thermoguttaceae bacterium]|jgi:two-component system chemotaxis response regulator CheY|nr:response regulator [Thermoguttaceae bacterium]